MVHACWLSLAVADLRLAEIDHEVDQNDDAIDAMASGLELVERLHSKFPDAKEEQVARILEGKSRPEAGHGDAEDDPAKGDETLPEVVGLWETLAREHPAVVAFQNDTAAAHASLAITLAKCRGTLRFSDLAKAGLDSSQRRSRFGIDSAQSHPEVPEYQESNMVAVNWPTGWTRPVATRRH